MSLIVRLLRKATTTGAAQSASPPPKRLVEWFRHNIDPCSVRLFLLKHKHLQSYLSEYVWRYNHRENPQAMFLSLLLRAARP